MRHGCLATVLLLATAVAAAGPVLADTDLRADLDVFPGGEDEAWDGAWATPGQTVVFDGTDSVPSASIDDYALDVGADGTYEYQDEDDDGLFEHAFVETGEHEVRLRVSNGFLHAYDLRTVTVEENQAPSAEIDYHPAHPRPNERIDLDPSNSSDDHGIETYLWTDESSGATYEQSQGDEDPWIKYGEPGTYRMTLEAFDTHAEASETTVQIRVGYGPDARLTASPTTVSTGEEVTFDPSNTRSGSASIEGFTLDVDGDGDSDYAKEEPVNVSHAYDEAGTYRVVLTVGDEEGRVDRDRASVTVEAADGGGSGGGGSGGDGLGGGGSGNRDLGGSGGPSSSNGDASEEPGSGGPELGGDGSGSDLPPGTPTATIEVDPPTPAVGEPSTFQVVADVEVDQAHWYVDGQRLDQDAPVRYTFSANGTHEVEVLVETPAGDTLADRVTVTAEGASGEGEEPVALPAPGPALVAASGLVAVLARRRREA